MAATPGNALDVTSAGLVNFDGTATFSGVTVTQHDVLVGASSNGITSISPSTSGFVLTSNGVSADPSFQAASGGFTPNSTLNFFDDFLCFDVATSFTGFFQNLGTTFTGNTGASDSAHPGILINSTTTNSYCLLTQGSTGPNKGAFILGGGSITLNWVFKIVTLSSVSSRYTLRCGIADTPNSGTNPSNGCYFEYTDNVNSGDWTTITNSATTKTTGNQSTAVTTGWHNAQITINAAASSVTFTMDGTSYTAQTTNIPTTVIAPQFEVSGTAASGSVVVDLFYITQTLTATR
jgi:hypothetical protein